MKKLIIVSVVIAMVVGLSLAFAGPDQKGNGLPKDLGKSYNFNVIALPKGDGLPELNGNFDGGNGKRIFISRTGSTQFFVQGGDNFAIVDHDGTDGKVGEGGAGGLTNPGIILPYDTNADAWDCVVFVRLLGPVDSSFHWSSWYWDDGTSVWVPIDDFTLNRNTKFTEKTSQILADGYEDILWEWDQKNRLRICQFRIFVLDN